ncbi:MAG: silent information regulator protein Sir2 [Planctomycetota bacterium]
MLTRRLLLLALLSVSLLGGRLALGASPADSAGNPGLDRGLVVRPLEGGRAYLSWRLLERDPADIAFDVYRIEGGHERKLNEQPIRKTTDYVDSSGPQKDDTRWSVRPVAARQTEVGGSAAAQGDPGQAYISIKLDGNPTVQKLGLADLDGDGRLDFVIKQPNSNVDPYDKYWKKSPGTYKLEAYSADGKFLWRYDLGWAIEQGIWYSPYVVYDFDGDGKAEVAVKTGEGDPRDADGRVQSGPEYLTILDGLTGKEVTRADWPARELFANVSRPYNYASRNQLGVALLDGKNTSLIVERGTYNLQVVIAYRLKDGKLTEQWRWSNDGLGKEWSGQGAHWMHAADIDADGREEIILGSSVLDDNGQPLWTTGLGHPDHSYVGDIDPLRPGLEIYYGMETRQKKNGMCLVDARTGEILWGYDEPTRHVHSYGMCGDIDPRYVGSECYSADTDAQKDFAFGLLYSAQGELIAREDMKFGPRLAYWDADLQRELVKGKSISKYGGEDFSTRIEGQFVATVDLLGDWREEIITTLPGELRIYVTTIPAADRRVCLLQDPIYRADVAHATMGYYQVPMTSYDLATSKVE